MSTVDIVATIGGQKFLPTAFAVHSGTYGSAGHAEIVTSITQMADAKIDLVQASLNATGGLEIDISVNVDGAGPVRIFGGEYVFGKWAYDADRLTIRARDWAGLLVDQKQVLTGTADQILSILAPGQPSDAAGVEAQNQTIVDLVTSIAKQYGFTPVINVPTADDSNVGAMFGSDDTVYAPVPASLWELLNEIARTTGYEVYVTPNKELVFGPPGSGTTPLALTWNVNPPPAAAAPVRNLSVVHNARRNASFRVLVMSYDPAKGQLTEGTAYVIGVGLTGSSQQTVAPGIWEGGATALIDTALSSAQLPIYTFHIDGLTQAQAQQRATAIATDIAKRQFVLEATADVIPSIVPMQQVGITGPIAPAFYGNAFYVNAYSHVFRLPKSPRDVGLVTNIIALDLAVEGAGTPLMKPAQDK